jgi:predicted O-methyltransferase YrrM
VNGPLRYATQTLLPEKLRRLFHSHHLRKPFAPNEGHCWTAHIPEWHHLADSPEAPQRSPLMLYENGVPLLEAHEPHQYIRTDGGGLFSHWQEFLYFSTSDNSDPNTNGRRYSYTVSPEFYRPRYRLRGPFFPNEGHCWTAALPQWRHLADYLDNLRRSRLMLYENGVPFLESHVPHQYIRTEGGGLFSHWHDFLYFSTSDNSDPNTNGRRYNFTVSPEFYRSPTRVWGDFRPNPSPELTGPCSHSYVFKRSPRLWYRIEELRAAYLHPRMSEEFFRRYLHEREEHPGYQAMSLARQISMLHDEVLMLLRLFVIASRGAVLEIGSYIGGATIVLAATAKEFRKGPVISIELGGAHNPPFAIPSTDIFSDLVRNVREAGVSDHVTLLNGFSTDPKVVESVNQACDGKKIDLLMIDADGEIGKDMLTYHKLLKTGAIIVLDDYISRCAPEKSQPVKEWVDQAVSNGTLSSLGVWGWGTWIGMYRGHSFKT